MTEFYKDKTKSDGRQSRCKVCSREWLKQYYQENKDRIREKEKQYRQKNKNSIKERKKQYRQENKDKIRERAKQYYQENKDRRREYFKQHQQENRDRVREYEKQKRQADPLFALRANIRTRCWEALKGSKSKKTTDMLGCSFEQLYFHLHLERFENPSHDHIIPLSWGETVEEIEILAHYTNLQGMEREENISKGNRRCSVAKAHKVLKQHPNPETIKTILNRKKINNGYYENN